MQVEVDVKCMQTNLVGMASLVLEILLLFKFGQISLSDPKWPNLPFRLWTIVLGGQKIELAQKVHYVLMFTFSIRFIFSTLFYINYETNTFYSYTLVLSIVCILTNI